MALKMADDLDARRALLEKRLAEHKAKTVEGAQESTGSDKAGMGQAIKISSEFIAGVVMGAGLGWGIDQLAGTSPFGMIVFLFLGFGAGILNVLRTAGVVAPQSLDDK
jgi:ATP synthase protein I